jgi:hypothetical protein
MQAWLREGNIGASHVAIPECSLRAKRTRGLESKLESLAGFGLHIRSPRVHVRPLAFQRAGRSGYIRVAADEGPLTSFGLVGVRGPAPVVVNSKDGRGPAVVLAGGLNGGLRS